MGFLRPPKPPPIVEPNPLPDPPSYEDEERQREILEKRATIRRNRKGRKSTILTTADGLEDNDSLIVKKKSLGG